MAAKRKLLSHLATRVLVADEAVVAARTAQIKGDRLRHVGKTAARESALALGRLLTTGNGGGGPGDPPPGYWVVVTTSRVLLIERTNLGRDLGACVFTAPRSALLATVRTGLLAEVTLTDRADPTTRLRLNFGVRRGQARQVAAALSCD